MVPVAAAGRVGRTRIRYGAALAPEVIDSADDSHALIAEKKAFLDKVQVEDRHVVEGIFRGAGSPLATSGPLSWMEQENHQLPAIWQGGFATRTGPYSLGCCLP